MNLAEILVREPVDRVARRVTSQTGVAEDDTPLTREELAALVNRLLRKNRLLRHVLGIDTKAKKVNTKYKAKKGIPQFRALKEPRALTEYLRCGQEIQRLGTELAALRKVRQFVAGIEREYKARAASPNTGEAQR